MQIWPVHIVDPSLGAMHVSDSFRETTLILRYILQCWFIDNIRVLTVYAELRQLFHLHVGDDVYIRAPTTSEGASLLHACQDGGLRMNPAKQSFGIVGMEFLRVASDLGSSYGYFARSVASAVSGAWDSEERSSGLSALMKYTHVSWTLGLGV